MVCASANAMLFLQEMRRLFSTPVKPTIAEGARWLLRYLCSLLPVVQLMVVAEVVFSGFTVCKGIYGVVAVENSNSEMLYSVFFGLRG